MKIVPSTQQSTVTPNHCVATAGGLTCAILSIGHGYGGHQQDLFCVGHISEL